MKTNINITITTSDEAKAFLTELFKNNEAYHCEDSAHDLQLCMIGTKNVPAFTQDECDQLDRLMDAVYAVAKFDPCEFIMDLLDEHEACINCDAQVLTENAEFDDEHNYYCKPCYEVLAPIMQQEYDELKAKGDIE